MVTEPLHLILRQCLRNERASWCGEVLHWLHPLCPHQVLSITHENLACASSSASFSFG